MASTRDRFLLLADQVLEDIPVDVSARVLIALLRKLSDAPSMSGADLADALDTIIDNYRQSESVNAIRSGKEAVTW